MKTVLRTMWAASAAVMMVAVGLLLAGCGTLSIFSPATTATTLKTANIMLTAYKGLIQPAILAVGHWQTCGPTVVTKVCKPQAAWDTLKGYEATATAAIVALSPVLDGTVTDTGQTAAAVDAVGAAQTAATTIYTAAGVTSPLGGK